MQPIDFKEANAKFTNIDGKETPAFKSTGTKGIFVVGYKFGFWERIFILFFGKIWFSQATHGANPRAYTITINKGHVLGHIKIVDDEEKK